MDVQRSTADSIVSAQLDALKNARKDAPNNIGTEADKLAKSLYLEDGSLRDDVSNAMRLKAWSALQGVADWSTPGRIKSVFLSKANLANREAHRDQLTRLNEQVTERLKHELAPADTDKFFPKYIKMSADATENKKTGELVRKFFKESVPVPIPGKVGITESYKKLGATAPMTFNKAIEDGSVRGVAILLTDGVKVNLNDALAKAMKPLTQQKTSARKELDYEARQDAWKIVELLVRAGAKAQNLKVPGTEGSVTLLQLAIDENQDGVKNAILAQGKRK